MSGKPLEERPQRSMEELIHAVLKDQPVQMQMQHNLPEGIQAQYIPKQRTVYVQNGMEENTTFHAVNRELACAALDVKALTDDIACPPLPVFFIFGADHIGVTMHPGFWRTVFFFPVIIGFYHRCLRILSVDQQKVGCFLGVALCHKIQKSF